MKTIAEILHNTKPMTICDYTGSILYFESANGYCYRRDRVLEDDFPLADGDITT